MLRSFLRRWTKDNKGAAALEFALVAPVFFLMVIGIIEFSLLMATQSILEGATASVGRTYKALAQKNQQGVGVGVIRNAIIDRGGGIIDPNHLRVHLIRLAGWGNASGNEPNTPVSNNTGGTGDITHYKVFYEYNLLTPLIGKFFDNGKLDLRASIVIQNEPDIKG